MKKIAFTIFTLAILFSITNSCKKGEEDPWISFKSRKARLVGDWVMYEGVSRQGSAVINYDGANAISGSNSWKYSQTMKFNGDGSYECNIESDQYYEKCTKIGTWAFGPKDKAMNLKAKEYLIIRLKDYTYYQNTTSGIIEMQEIYTDDACPVEMLRLKELKTKQITFEGDGTALYHYGNYDSSYVETYEKIFERN